MSRHSAKQQGQESKPERRLTAHPRKQRIFRAKVSIAALAIVATLGCWVNFAMDLRDMTGFASAPQVATSIHLTLAPQQLHLNEIQAQTHGESSTGAKDESPEQ